MKNIFNGAAIVMAVALLAGLLFPVNAFAAEGQSEPDISEAIEYVDQQDGFISPNGDSQF